MKYKQFEDKYQYPDQKQRDWEKKQKHKGKTVPKKREWTPEDQAYEDILWAS